MLTSSDIAFRKLQLTDLPRMHSWLNSPHVREWYDRDKESTLEEITKRYGPKIRGEKPTGCYLVLYRNKPAAYIQTYKVNDWPDFGDHVGYDDATASVDLFIGETNLMGKGFGSLLLRKFLQEIVFSNPDTHTCIIGPEPSNTRAIKAYEKVGFRYVKTLQIPGEPEETYLMELTREAVLGWYFCRAGGNRTPVKGFGDLYSTAELRPFVWDCCSALDSANSYIRVACIVPNLPESYY